MVRETWQNTKLSFSSLICQTNLKDIDEKVIETNTYLENYCKQQNLDFNDSDINKSDLNSRGLHLLERGGSKLAKRFLDYLYWVCAAGNSFPRQSEQSKLCIVKELRNNKLSHSKCVSLGCLNINSIRNKFSSILHLIDKNLVIFAIAETKLDSLFPESQFILSGIRKPFRLDVTNRKGGLLMFVNNDIPSKDLRGFHLPRYTGYSFWDKFKTAQATCRFYISTSISKLKIIFLSSITGLLDHYLKPYEDFVMVGYFNANESNPAMQTFLNKHKCKNIITLVFL